MFKSLSMDSSTKRDIFSCKNCISTTALTSVVSKMEAFIYTTVCGTGCCFVGLEKETVHSLCLVCLKLYVYWLSWNVSNMFFTRRHCFFGESIVYAVLAPLLIGCYWCELSFSSKNEPTESFN